MPNTKYLKGTHIQLRWPRSGFTDSTWTREKVTGWVKHAGGNITMCDVPPSNITHFVCDEDIWPSLKDGCEKSWVDLTGKSVTVVSPAWLEESLSEQKKAKTNHYQLTKAPEPPDRREQLKTGPQDGVQNMMDVFTQATAGRVHPQDQAEVDAELAAVRAREEAARAAEEREDNARKQEARRLQNVSTFQNDYHVYHGPDGFIYDILVTKADVNNNKGQRTYITIYRSKKEPHVYATSAHLDNDGPRHTGETVLASHGVNFHTARRQFFVLFEEFTYLKWEHRRERYNYTSELAQEDKPWVYRAPLAGPAGDLQLITDDEI